MKWLENKSWKTMAMGVFTIISTIAGAAVLLLDGDPLTNPNWASVSAAITAGVGLLAARDNNKSSEDVGAKP